MRLYFKPGACSLAARIILTELDLPYEALKVDTEAGLVETGADYRQINPHGYVPALELNDGVVITENPAILQYLAGSNDAHHLAPANSAHERAQLQSILSFTSSELHKAYSPYFAAQPLDEAAKKIAEVRLFRRIGDVERELSDGRRYILGETFTIADAYLFVVLNWSNFIGVNLDRWPAVAAYVTNIATRPSVREAMLREGLITEKAV